MKKLIVLVCLAVFAATTLAAPAIAGPVCKDINTGAVIECPADSTIMPWDETITVREMTDKDFEYLVFFAGVISIAVFTVPFF